MGRKLKRGKAGNAAQYLTRNQAIKKLQLRLSEFRRLCILKGVHPREPKKKTAGAHKTYYHAKDINWLAHEPLIESFRAVKVHERRVRKARAKQHESLARRLLANKPGYKLDHLVKERYPSFVDALRDLDDPLTLVHLFATLPAEGAAGISPATTQKCRRLVLEWNAWVARTSSLRKVFVSVKGFYYQAEVSGASVTWLVPHQLAQVLPADVDYAVMVTFLEFYCTLLQFVLFKLYHSLGLRYPPLQDRRLEAAAAGLAGIMKDIATLQQDQQDQQQQQEQNGGGSSGDAAAAAVPEVVQRLGTLGRKIQELKQQQQQEEQQGGGGSKKSAAAAAAAAGSESGDADEDVGEIDSGGSDDDDEGEEGSEEDGERSEEEGEGEQQGGSSSGEGEDEEEEESEGGGEEQQAPAAAGAAAAAAGPQAGDPAAAAAAGAAVAGGGLGSVDADDDAGLCGVLLAGCVFFLAREVPREPLLFMIRAFGGVAGWDGEGSPVAEGDESITHQIVDRPTQGHRFLSRAYVQPQWLFDSLNHRVLMPADLYAPGRPPPPHLSPFVDDADEGYTPEFALTVKQLQEAARAARRAAAGAATEAAFLQDEQQQGGAAAGGSKGGEDAAAAERSYQKELARELRAAAGDAAAADEDGGSSSGADDDDASEGDEQAPAAKQPGGRKRPGAGAGGAEEDEEGAMADIMMTRKTRKLYGRINRAIEGKAERVAVLEQRKRALAESGQQQQQGKQQQAEGGGKRSGKKQKK